MITLKNVLVATDFGEAAERSTHLYGRTLASRFGANLHALYVSQDVYFTALGAESYAVNVPDLERQFEEEAL